MLQTQQCIVIMISLPSIVISSAHYSFAHVHLICAVIGKYITFLYVTGPNIYAYIYTYTFYENAF